jgi:hypothetical protein
VIELLDSLELDCEKVELFAVSGVQTMVSSSRRNVGVVIRSPNSVNLDCGRS